MRRVALLSASWAWLAVAALLAGGSLAGWWLPAWLLDWQPGVAGREPWRLVTAAWVHWSAAHLVTNLSGIVVLAALGAAARMPAAAALAWLLAWPLTQAALVWQPGLQHYGGASGVVHAGVAVATAWLLVFARGRRWWIGLAMAVVLSIKLLGEGPWIGARVPAAWLDIAVVPWVHAAGAMAGAGCALIVAAAVWWRVRRRESAA